MSRLERRRAVAAVDVGVLLPVAMALEPIRDAIRDVAVTIVAGETGSGKSTLLPRIAAIARPELAGRIAITQPRRVAARAIATRVSAELGQPLGEWIGYRTRFESQLKPEAPVVAITDGLLLQDLHRDRQLRSYDTIIVDEVHERSVAIDFLLGVLARLLRTRPELRVVLSSATLDAQRLATHFQSAGHATQIITVEGRLHPVEVRWSPPPDEDSVIESAADHVATLLEAGEGDCLCFLPGEAEIAQVQEILVGRLRETAEVLPLFARLSSAEQDRVFSPGQRPRAILATNIAETSLTVPRIRSVVDAGLARMARYSTRSRVMRLPLEPISQAAAQQRAGRAGRLGPGVCVRLCDEAEFSARPAFTEPEIRRTNLAGVILRMASLRLGAPERFEFVDRPAERAIAEARDSLREIGALKPDGHLTPIGQRLAELPIDPRLGAVLLASVAAGCPAEAAVVTSFLSTTDPRVRPADAMQQAGVAHSAWRDPKSDFGTIVRMWQAWTLAREANGSSALKRWCRTNYLSQLRLREWQFVHDQLRRTLVGEGVPPAIGISEPMETPKLHRALVHGLACVVAERANEGHYKLPSGQSLEIHPSSVLARSEPRWIVAAEVVDTGRRQARLCGVIRSEWVAEAVQHGLRRTVSEPHWVLETGHVAAWEQVHWGALTVVQRSRIPYGPLDAAGARDILIQSALVDGHVPTELPFTTHNAVVIERIREEERRRRRTGLVASDQERFGFFDSRLPRTIHDWPSLRRWYREASRQDPTLLCLADTDARSATADRGMDDSFPDAVRAGGSIHPIRYAHSPGEASDGATVSLSSTELAAMPDEPAVRRLLQPLPGHRPEIVESLVRALPKGVRQRLGTNAAIVESVTTYLAKAGGELSLEWEAWLRWIGGDAAAADAACATEAPSAATGWSALPVATHLLPRVEVADQSGALLVATRDPKALLECWRRLHTARPERAAPTQPTPSPAAASLARWKGAITHHLEFDARWNEFVLAARILGPRAGDDMLVACAERALAQGPGAEAQLHIACRGVLGEALALALLASRVAAAIERASSAHPRFAKGVAEFAERALPPGILRSGNWGPASRAQGILRAIDHALQRPPSEGAGDPSGWTEWQSCHDRLGRLRLRAALREAGGVPSVPSARLGEIADLLEWMPVAILAPHLRPPNGSTPIKWRRLVDDLDRDLTISTA